MPGEFETKIKQLTDNQTSQKVVEMLNMAGSEFPCLTCPSNQDCGTFKWFQKWFGEQAPKVEG